jgi:hypothetical protein
MQNTALKSKSPKKSDISTPLNLVKFIFDIVCSVIPQDKIKTILDPCAGLENRLTHCFSRAKVVSYEKKLGKDFFDAKKEDCADVDLVLVNPPFNNDVKHKKTFLPEEFLRKIIEIVPANTPIVMIVPAGFRLNVRKRSKRFLLLSELEVQSIATLPLDVFEDDGILFHTEILFIGSGNFSKLKPHYTYHQNTIIQKPPENSKSLHNKLLKFTEIDSSLLSVMRSIAFSLSLQERAGQLLAALVYKLDSNNKFIINADSRTELAALIDSSPQVITNQIKMLCDTFLIKKVARGSYTYDLLSPENIRKIISQDFDSISVELKFFKNDFSPKPLIIIE